MIGRPSKFRGEYCNRLEAHMKKGLSFESFAGAIGVSKDTLYEWRKVHSDFSESYKKGKMASLLFWEKLGIKGASGHVKHFNAASYCFNMKNRFDWRDKGVGEESHETIIKIAYDPRL